MVLKLGMYFCSGADVYFDGVNDDPRFKGLSAEESFARATSLAIEESMKTAAKSVRTVMSFGEVEMSEIYGWVIVIVSLLPSVVFYIW